MFIFDLQKWGGGSPDFWLPAPLAGPAGPSEIKGGVLGGLLRIGVYYFPRTATFFCFKHKLHLKSDQKQKRRNPFLVNLTSVKGLRREKRGSRFKKYSTTLCDGIESMRKLVYAFYDDAFSFGRIFRKHPDLRSDMTDCLIGNLFRNFERLFKAIGEFAEVPAQVNYGGPDTHVTELQDI